MTFRHKEAFALMWYACPCGHRERIWNSRDGVTPFGGLLCTSCGGKGLERHGLSHIDFHLDEYAPDHKLQVGQLFFRDGTAADSIDIIERRIAALAKMGQPVPDNVASALRCDAINQTGEWRQGWPTVGRHAPRSDEIERDAKAVVANWDEFGPDGGLDERMEILRRALASSRSVRR